jgi:hypothetical protein
MSIKSMTTSNLLALANTFTSQFTANKDALPSVSASENTALADAVTALQTAESAKVAANNAKKTATELYQAKKAVVAGLLSLISNKVAANKTSTDVILAVGLRPKKSIRSTIIPHTISDLVAAANANGTNKLTWLPNMNKYGVHYDVEGRFGDDGEWMLIGSTQNRRYKHTGQTPGNYCEYRIITRAAKSSSDPSASVVVYPRMFAPQA